LGPPTRLFHWSLASLVVFSFTTGKLGGDWLTWHFRSGYAIASLLLFRLLWGFAGSRYARFASFLPSPSRIWRTVRSKESGAVPALLNTPVETCTASTTSSAYTDSVPIALCPALATAALRKPVGQVCVQCNQR
jgi:Prokaryotic cytochrome b561